MHTSAVRPLGGVPTLFVDDAPVEGLAYITYLPERNDFKAFADAGHRLYSVVAYFAARTVNEATKIAPFAPGIFEDEAHPDYTAFDQTVRDIIAARPDALIFPRVNTSVTRAWEAAHPDECNDTGYGNRCACFSSKLWLDTCARHLRAFIDHTRNSDYADHIIGYQVAGGNTEEWFSFDQVGSVGPRARAAFIAEGGDPSDAPAFYAYLSRATVRALVTLARVAKECVGWRQVVGSFYGYTFECPWRESGHMALSTLLRAPDVDFLCSPASYAFTRRSGRDWACMTALDSLKLHGKLYFTEYDTSTHLTREIRECRENACVPGTYEGGRWLGPTDPDETIGVLRMNFARQLTHGHACWWFDMWGGWFHDDAMLSEMAAYPPIARAALSDAHRQSVAQVAVFADETGVFRLPDKQLAIECLYKNRDPLGAAGAPYDAYDISDWQAVKARYRAVVFLAPYPTDALQAAQADCVARGIPTLVANADHPTLTTAELRALYARAGVFSYCETDDPVYVSENYIALHAATAGNKTLRLPRVCRITPLLPPGEAVTADTVDLNVKAFETRLYRLDAPHA